MVCGHFPFSSTCSGGGVSNAGWLAGSDPLVPLQNSEGWGPTFWIRMGLLGIVWGPNSNNHQHGPFFSWFGRPFFGVSTKDQSLKRRKTYKTLNGSTKNASCQSMVFLRMCFLPKGKCTLQNARFFFHIGLPLF